jgi:hypothetical protein
MMLCQLVALRDIDNEKGDYDKRRTCRYEEEGTLAFQIRLVRLRIMNTG